jgi:hypothetical protein
VVKWARRKNGKVITEGLRLVGDSAYNYHCTWYINKRDFCERDIIKKTDRL